MNFFKPKTFLGFIPLRVGAFIILIITFFGDIIIFNNTIPNFIVNLIGLLLVDIGMVGVFIRKSYCIRAHIYYFIFQSIFNTIFTYGFSIQSLLMDI